MTEWLSTFQTPSEEQGDHWGCEEERVQVWENEKGEMLRSAASQNPWHGVWTLLPHNPSLAARHGPISANSILPSYCRLLAEAQVHLLSPFSWGSLPSWHSPESVQAEEALVEVTVDLGSQDPNPFMLSFLLHSPVCVLKLSPRWQDHILPGPGCQHFLRHRLWGRTNRTEISMTIQLPMAQAHWLPFCFYLLIQLTYPALRIYPLWALVMQRHIELLLTSSLRQMTMEQLSRSYVLSDGTHVCALLCRSPDGNEVFAFYYMCVVSAELTGS